MIKKLIASVLIALTGALFAMDKNVEKHDYSFIKKIRPEHPRLFLSKEIIANLKKNMTPLQKKYLEDMRKEVDSFPLMPNLIKPTIRDCNGSYNDWASKASSSALVFIFTGKQEYKEKAIGLLRFTLSWYHKRYSEKKAINWFAYTRIAALCAYDWLYNHLSKKERMEIGKSLFKHIEMTQDGSFTRQIPKEGPSGPSAGYYGVPNLAWYGGLAFFDDGINDKKAGEFLKKGYQEYMFMFRKRSKNASANGGSNTATTGYAAGAYYIQEYNFFYTWKSAIGGNFAEKFPKLSLFPNWLLWTMIQGPDGKILEYGTGDAWHTDNKLKLPSLYLIQYKHFYKKINPKMCKVVDFLLSKIKSHKNKFSFYKSFLDSSRHQERHMSATPFLFAVSDIDRKSAEQIIKKMPRSENFPILGQTFMNTGWGEDSTYCLFTAGAGNNPHKHYDENNFVIYKKGFLAIDSGTRCYYKNLDVNYEMEHMRNYYPRTIAHNCILIKMKNEKFPKYGWPVKNIPEANDGGMRKRTGAGLLAFQTNEKFTYVASDSTKTYHEDKASKVVRQFVFVYPNFFVVFDRIVSKAPNQNKTWLLHTQNEPVIKNSITETTHWGGKLFCKTLLPKNAVIKKIGGPGKEFWSDGKNWPIGLTKAGIEKKSLFGNWRIEASPEKDKKEINFLNLIQVGDGKILKKMTSAELIKDGAMEGVKFKNGNEAVKVLFNASGKVGGKIKIEKDSEYMLGRFLGLTFDVMEKQLSNKIQSQKAGDDSSRTSLP